MKTIPGTSLPQLRRRHHRIDSLPLAYREEIHRFLAAGRTFREIAEATRAWGEPIAPSSICRYAQHRKVLELRSRALLQARKETPGRAVKPSRRRHNRIGEFPPDVRVEIDRLIRTGGTYREIRTWLQEKGYRIGLASLCRHGQALLADDALVSSLALEARTRH